MLIVAMRKVSYYFLNAIVLVHQRLIHNDGMLPDILQLCLLGK